MAFGGSSAATKNFLSLSDFPLSSRHLVGYDQVVESGQERPRVVQNLDPKRFRGEDSTKLTLRMAGFTEAFRFQHGQ